MRMAMITAFSPYGVKVEFKASKGNSLGIGRESPSALFVDIRDEGMPKHEDGFARLIAQVPSSWVLVPVWEIEAANESEAAPEGKPETVRHTGAVIPTDGCVCQDCNDARARKRTEKSGKSPKWTPPDLDTDGPTVA